MHIQIRASDRYESLSEYRAAQARAFIQRNAPAMRREFWERKQRESAETAELESI